MRWSLWALAYVAIAWLVYASAYKRSNGRMKRWASLRAAAWGPVVLALIVAEYARRIRKFRLRGMLTRQRESLGLNALVRRSDSLAVDPDDGGFIDG